jgi:serine protease Do
MQLEYYRSPYQGGYPGLPPRGDGRPRRTQKIPTALIVSLAVILALILALAVLRVLNRGGFLAIWDSWGFSSEDPDFTFRDPDDFYSYFDDPFSASESTTLTTIPKADPEPGVRLTLSGEVGQTLSFQEIYDKVLPSIVSVQAYSKTSGSSGTGVIMTADGYIITNHHVIAGCSSAQIVLFDGTSYAAKLVGSDVGSDLAVLKIDAQGLSAAEFGNSNLVRVGDVVLAMGNPLGSELFGTMTDGIVSAINRDVNVDGYTMTLIQTTAALNPGNSGGALINESGQVVGITNLKMMSDYETIEGLGFAIPTVWAKEVVDVLLSDGAITGRPTLGITGLTIPTDQEETYGRDSGVYVNSVTANGPAAQAGVQPGDVITQANGQSVATIQDLTDVRDEVGVGGTLTLTVWRDGETLELTLTLVDQYELN